MKRVSTRVAIPGSHGKLAAIIDAPQSGARAMGIFSHCFSCTKDLKAIVKISRGLTRFGFGVVRFDFAGLGGSEGDFSDTTFEDNLADVRAVVSWMESQGNAPQFLLGHSLGGAAMLATAMEFESVKAVSVIASPSDTRHLADTIYRLNPEVEDAGSGMVNTGTYEYLLKKNTIDVLRRYDLPQKLSALSKRVLVFHSPADSTLGMKHGQAIMERTNGPASLVDLETANHLLTDDPRDCDWISHTMAGWLQRYLDSAAD